MKPAAVHSIRALGAVTHKDTSGVRTLCMTALTALLLSTCLATPAYADCPAAPLASADDMVVSFIASQGGTQAAPSTLFASTVKEGMLVYDDTNNTLKLCDGTNWVALQAGTALAAGTVTGAVQFRGATGLLDADDTNFIWDDTNNRLGIGTATANNTLEVHTATGNANIRVRANAGGAAELKLQASADDTSKDAILYLANTDFGSGDGFMLQWDHGADKFVISDIGGSNRLVVDTEGRVGIGTISPHTSALLDLTSADKGFLPPRMTTTDVGNIATPADGLIVYDTTADTLKLRANGAWTNLAFGGAGGGASAAGNSGEIQFNDGASGLTADSSLFWDNTNKRLGVGNATPSTAVEVTGTIKSSGPLWSSFGNAGTHRGIILENYDDTANTNGVDVAAKLGGTEFQGINWLQETAWVSGDADADKDVMLQFGVLTDNVATIPMVLRASGDVGIGTAGPDAKLHVAGGVKIGDDTGTCPGSGNVKLGTLRFNSGNFEVCQSGGWAAAAGGASGVGGAGYVQISDGSGGLTTSGTTAGQEFFWDNTNKRLGIGTATPSGNLQIEDTGGNMLVLNGAAGSERELTFSTAGNARWILGANGTAEGGSNAGSDLYLNAYTDAGAYLSTGMFIQRSSGNVGLGTIGPVAKLDVSGGVKLGDQTTCTNGTHNGTLRWNSNNLEICTASGWATITGPGVDVINGTALSSGTFPQANGSTIYSSGGSYDLGSMAVEKGVYIWTVYNCAGQLSYSSGSGTTIQIVGATVIHSSSTWAKLDTAPDSTCGSIYTGVFKSNGTGTAAVRVSSASGSVLTKPSATAFGVYANKIAGGGGVYGGGAGSGNFLADGSIPMTGDLDMDGNDIIGAGAIGVGTDTPHASAMLDLTSTSQGFLPPRMSEAQRDAIASPATGLMIFNTDSGRPEFYGGTGWVPMGLIFDGSSSMAAAPSASYLDAIGVNQNGTYWLKPDGYGSAAFQAFIDFDGTASGITDPGPWVRIAYAQDYYSQASPWMNTGVSTSPGASSLLFGTQHTAAEVNAILSTCTESRQSFTSAGYKSVGWTYSGSPKNVGYMTVLNWWGGASGSNSNSTAGAAYWPASLDYSFSNINTFNNTGTDETDANDAVWRTDTIYIRDTTATYLPITRISHSDVDGTDEGRHFPLLSSGSHTWCK